MTKKVFEILLIILLSLVILFSLFQFFSINGLVIFVKESEITRKPFSLLFIGCILLAFVIVCIFHKKHHKK